MDRLRIRRGAPLAFVLGAAIAASACGLGRDERAEIDKGSPAGGYGGTAGLVPVGPPSIQSAEAESPLPKLRAFEGDRRGKADFATMPASDRVMGADPYSIQNLRGTANFVSIARGQDAVILLDGSLHELARAKAPASPTGLAINTKGDVFVSGELSSAIGRYRIKGASIERNGTIELPDVKAIRGLAAGPEPGVIYAVEEHDGRLITLTLGEPARGSSVIPFRREDAKVCSAASRVARARGAVIIDCIIDHELVVRRVNTKGIPAAEGEARIKHDGPIWSFDAIPTGASGDDLLIAAGGVEDHPLDRTEGSFGFIDSFVFLYRLTKGSPAPERLAEVNVSSLGVITPKAIHLAQGPDGVVVEVTGYGGKKRATLVFAGEPRGEPRSSTSDLWPGTTSMAEGPDGARVYSNPLLDAWILERSGAPLAVVPVDDADGLPRAIAPGTRARLGEALFFTSLMAPWNKTEGRLSRFTCETCHFEGYVDGRTHHTGRGDVHATTKPLLGLFNNRPHFSRALDPDLSSIAHNEFRVAGANSGHDPMFALSPQTEPFLAELGAAPPGGSPISPADLRVALMDFLMGFTHRPNPSVVGRSTFTAEERAGAAVFRDRCESCHKARLSTDDPASSVPFERWEALVMSREGPIVWASADYKKTGVEPYVHEKGARVPSLRRLFKKRPYFTNGSAKTLADVLDRLRMTASPGAEAFYHDKAPEGAGLTGLDARDKAALLAFLDLL